MKPPYRSPATPPPPPRPYISGAFLHALLKAHPWLGVVLGILGPLASLSPEDPVRWRVVLFCTMSSSLLAAAWRVGDAPYVRRQLWWFGLLCPLSSLLTGALFYGGFNRTHAPPAPVRLVVPRGERFHLPHRTIITVGHTRVLVLGGATLITDAPLSRCLPPYGPIEENVMYTPDCDREAE